MRLLVSHKNLILYFSLDLDKYFVNLQLDAITQKNHIIGALSGKTRGDRISSMGSMACSFEYWWRVRHRAVMGH